MATTAPSPIGREVFVHIIVDQNGAIKVDPDTFWVSKGKNEEVVWSCASTDPNNPHADFEVHFNKNGSPFYESRFSKDYPCSGLVKRDVKPSDPKGPNPYIYKYTVRVGANSLDPGGGVTP